MKKLLHINIIILTIIISFNNTLSENLPQMLDSANHYMKIGEFEKSNSFAQIIIGKFENDIYSYDSIYTQSMNVTVQNYFQLRKLDSAIINLEILLKIFQEKDLNKFAEVAQSLGTVNKAMQKFDKAIEYLKQSIDAARIIPNYEVLIWGLIDFGGLNLRYGEFTLAEPALLEAYELANRHLNKEHEYHGQVNNSLAVFYNQNLAYHKAEKHFREALSIYNLIYKEDNPKIAGTLVNLGDCILKMERFEESEGYYKSGIEMMKNIVKGDNQQLALYLNNFGYLYIKKGDFKKAERYLNESLEMRKRLYPDDNFEIAHSYQTLGELFRRIDLKRAEHYYEKALNIYQNIFKTDNYYTAKCYEELGSIYRTNGNFEEAELHLSKSLESMKNIFGTDHPALASIMINYGTLNLRTKKYELAEEQYLKAYDINKKNYKKFNNPPKRSIYILANYYFQTGKYDIAKKYIDELIEINEEFSSNYLPFNTESDQDNLLLENLEYYSLYDVIAIKNIENNPELAIELMDIKLKNNGRMLHIINKLRKSIYEGNDKVSIDEYRTWLVEKEYITRLNLMPQQQILQMKINLDSLNDDLEKNEKGIIRNLLNSNRYNENDDLNFKNLKMNLQEDEVAIQICKVSHYFVVPDKDSTHYFALITKNDSEYPEIYFFPDAYALENEFFSVYKAELKHDRDNKVSYSNYWQGLAEKISGFRRVYISVDGIFHQISLSTLKNPVTKKYLDDEIELIQLANLRDIVSFKSNPALNNNEYVLLGNPDFDNYPNSIAKTGSDATKVSRSLNINRNFNTEIDLTPLKYAKEEIDGISKILQNYGKSYKTFTGMNANEENLKMINNPKALHISTHGYFLKDPEFTNKKTYEFFTHINSNSEIELNPLLRSMLFLSGSKKSLEAYMKEDYSEITTYDGILTAKEAQNLNLYGTELVVLAACETGLGDIKYGEGVFGLQRAFIQAGAKSLIMSLWRANDKATKDLMVVFYEEWLKGNTKRKAFDIAKKNIRKKYKYPEIWGAFVLIGD